MLEHSIKWPPNYKAITDWRATALEQLRADKSILPEVFDQYKNDPAGFISDWMDTIDPRRAALGESTKIPFILFPRQRELIQFFHACLEGEAHGLVEKSRDMGATWAATSYGIWLWLFRPGSSIGFGSRKAQLVDRIGDMDSIFEKLRAGITSLPAEFRPASYDAAYMKIVNHDNGASITGESGDEIGRGGRKLLYFVDEAAHLEHPEMIEAALSENTRVRVDISSVNGVGNVFYRRREASTEWESGTPIHRSGIFSFILDWRDHPAKDQNWYNERRKKFEDEGLQHIFAQEVDRNYTAAIANTIIPLEWIRSAVDAHKKFDGSLEIGQWVAALDVADSGGDRNAFVKRKGVVLKLANEWGERDTGLTARRAVDLCRDTTPIQVMYDCIGVGSGVKAETNRLYDERVMPSGINFIPWDAGSAVLMPDKRVVPGDKQSPLNKDFYGNLKAQGWWALRRRFELTHRAVNENIKVNPDDLISLPSDLPRLHQIEKELAQPTTTFSGRMRLLVEKMPEGTRSPNLADAIMMAYFPSNQSGYNWRGNWIS